MKEEAKAAGMNTASTEFEEVTMVLNDEQEIVSKKKELVGDIDDVEDFQQENAE